MKNEFTQLNLRPELVQAVVRLGYTTPTEIQRLVIPLLLGGQDVIGQAQTGTGKTAAFALPILQTMAPANGQVQALILTPTRELALQVAQAFESYRGEPQQEATGEVETERKAYQPATVLAVYGGQAYTQQIRSLKKGVDIVVGTPGRLLDLMERQLLDLSAVRALVLDEADEMLSMGFIEDIEAILQATPPTRQTALFSATMPAAIRQLAGRYMRNPQSVTVQQKQLTVATIEQRYYLINEADRLAALTRLFEVEPISSALIFVRTRLGAAELTVALTKRGFPAEALHGDLSQEGREQVLGRFRQNQIKVLVATDVAARGLDIEDISHVFNYDLPTDPEVYVHRIGRTGRAGKSGLAISLVTPAEQWRLRKIEAYSRQPIVRATVPTPEEILALREKALVEKMAIWLRRGRYNRERELVAELVEAGHDPWEVAAAALKLARAEEKQRPIATMSEVVEIAPARERRAPRRDARPAARTAGDHRRDSKRSNRPPSQHSHEAGMVRLSMNAGKAQGIGPSDVVGTIARHADIPGNAIGAIHIQENHTLVDISEQFVAQVLAQTSNYRIRRLPVTIERTN